MNKREKVIKELDKLADEVNPWKESPPLRCDIPYPLLCDAIALLKVQEEKVKHLDNIILECAKEVFRLQTLLKEQEPKTVKEMLVVGEHLMSKCPRCSKILTVQDHPVACGFCGQAVKWT